jgi:hypothetical protein
MPVTKGQNHQEDFTKSVIMKSGHQGQNTSCIK